MLNNRFILINIILYRSNGSESFRLVTYKQRRIEKLKKPLGLSTFRDCTYMYMYVAYALGVRLALLITTFVINNSLLTSDMLIHCGLCIN